MMNGMGLRPWVYARLGFCSLGSWRHLHRGAMPGDIVAWDKQGQEIARHRHQFCDQHLTDVVVAMSSVPHTGEIETTAGDVISWSTDGDERD